MKKMNELIEKLMKECNELIIKYNKLDSFMNTKEYDALDDYIKEKMKEQIFAMLNYKWALRSRIEYMLDDQLKV